MKNETTPVWVIFLLAVIAGFSLVTVMHYPGRGYIYALFAIVSNALLFFGLRRDSLFFDTFLGIFFWLGFWLKFSVRTVFADGKFYESVGFFDYSSEAYDRALLVASCGIVGLLAARLLRERVVGGALTTIKFVPLDGLRHAYNLHRNIVWLGFGVLVLAVTLSNATLGIYQRGTVPRTVLPFGLGGIYTWLLLFGASSISAVLLHFELQLRSKISLAVILLVLMETFLSNVSMLSRGMILNAGAILLGTYICARSDGVALRLRTIGQISAMLLVLFYASILVVNQMRVEFHEEKPNISWSLQKIQVNQDSFGGVGRKLLVLVMDRWVGMEGVLAVTSYPELGWDLWGKVWREKYSDRGTSFYDRSISESSYGQRDMSNRHFVSVPGVLAFFFYPGSFLFLFLAMFSLGSLGAAIEVAVYKWGGGNLILCSLMAFVVAYRYVHFGYVPGQSYLLAGALVLNVALIYLLGRTFSGGHITGAARCRGGD